VIACDQFTSEPEYWQQVEKFVGEVPSTLRLTFPEIYLEQPDKESRITRIQNTMREYLEQSVLEPHSGMVYEERTVDGKTRRGLLLALDLERYDTATAQSRSGAEGTIVEELPP
jgi:hypothetical protein